MNKLLTIVAMGALAIGQVMAQSKDSAVTTTAPEKEVSTQNSTNEASSSAIDEKLSTLKGKIDGLQEDYLATKPTVDKLAKLKVSGYVQAQFVYTPTTKDQLGSDYKNKYDIGQFQGGKLPAGSKSVFQVRRARLKFAYQNTYSQMVVQLDCLPFTFAPAVNSVTQDTSKKVTSANGGPYYSGGGVSVKDAYLHFNEPILNSLGITAGICDRPFGFEIPYSSSSLESPERSRVIQSLFPGEKDLGVSLEYTPADNLPLWAQLFNFKGGFFAGDGANIEIDEVRDFIGRFGLTIPLNDLNMAIDGGVSGYVGSIMNRDTSVYDMDGSSWKRKTVKKFGSYNDRKYLGVDGQYYYGDVPFFGGLSLRGEYVSGFQPTVAGGNTSQNNDQPISGPLYNRPVEGYYAMAVLNVDPINCQLVYKYDVFDPNTKMSGTQVTDFGDMKFTTNGFGLVYHWDENVKLMAYFDRVENEAVSAKVKSGSYVADARDNVFTFRILYKF